MSVRFSIWFSRNQISLLPVADVGFPIGEPKIWQLFPENCIEIRKIGLRGGGVRLCAPKSAIYCVEKWKQWRVQSRCDCQVTGKTGHHSNWGNFMNFVWKRKWSGHLVTVLHYQCNNSHGQQWRIQDLPRSGGANLREKGANLLFSKVFCGKLREKERNIRPRAHPFWIGYWSHYWTWKVLYKRFSSS